MENDFTTSGSQMIIDTRGLNSGNYRFIVRKTNACGDAPWSQEVTVSCPQCHHEPASVNEVPEPWANFVPCNPEDPNSPCHHLLQSSNSNPRVTAALPKPFSSHAPSGQRKPRPSANTPFNLGSAGHSSNNNAASNNESRWESNSRDRSQTSFNYNDPTSAGNGRANQPVYPSTYDWGYPEPTCDWNDPNSNCYNQQPERQTTSQTENSYCDPRRPLLPCHNNNVSIDTVVEQEVCDSNDPSSPCFNPFPSWDEAPYWTLPERDHTDGRVNNDGWAGQDIVDDEDCDGTDKPCHHRQGPAQPVAPV